MRLDKYLKVSRIIKRRTVAADACSAGRVSVNGIVRKPGFDVQPGDRIEITLGDKRVEALVSADILYDSKKVSPKEKHH